LFSFGPFSFIGLFKTPTIFVIHHMKKKLQIGSRIRGEGVDAMDRFERGMFPGWIREAKHKAGAFSRLRP
jgi:hypothetical protein